MFFLMLKTQIYSLISNYSITFLTTLIKLPHHEDIHMRLPLTLESVGFLNIFMLYSYHQLFRIINHSHGYKIGSLKLKQLVNQNQKKLLQGIQDNYAIHFHKVGEKYCVYSILPN